MTDDATVADGDHNLAVLRHHETAQERATAQANRHALTAAVDAFASGDADAFWTIFDEAVVFHEAPCLPYGGAHVGLAATQRAYAHLNSVFSRLDAKFEAVLAARDLVILYQTVTFSTEHRGEIGTFPVAELFRFRDGKIIEWRAHYFDSNLIATAFARA